MEASSFGKLSGEIRNRIYSYCTDPSIVILAPVGVSTYDGLFKKSPDRRRFYGLTQTCRVLRTEFLPWYLHDTEIRVAIRNLSKYLRAFFPLRSPEVMSKYVGRFIVVIDWEEFEDVDLLRLLLLQLDAPKVDCRFGSRYEGLPSSGYWLTRAGDLNTLFARPTSELPKWRNAALRKYLEEGRIHSIRVSNRGDQSGFRNYLAVIKVVFTALNPSSYSEDLVEVQVPFDEWESFRIESGLMDLEYFKVKIVRLGRKGEEPVAVDWLERVCPTWHLRRAIGEVGRD